MRFIEKRYYYPENKERSIYDGTGEWCSLKSKGSPDIKGIMKEYGESLPQVYCVQYWDRRVYWLRTTYGYYNNDIEITFNCYEYGSTEIK